MLTNNCFYRHCIPLNSSDNCELRTSGGSRRDVSRSVAQEKENEGRIVRRRAPTRRDVRIPGDGGEEGRGCGCEDGRAVCHIEKGGEKSRRKVCAVCEPEICCADLEGKQLPPRPVDKAIYFSALRIAKLIRCVTWTGRCVLRVGDNEISGPASDPITARTLPGLARFYSTRSGGIM